MDWGRTRDSEDGTVHRFKLLSSERVGVDRTSTSERDIVSSYPKSEPSGTQVDVPTVTGRSTRTVERTL